MPALDHRYCLLSSFPSWNWYRLWAKSCACCLRAPGSVSLLAGVLLLPLASMPSLSVGFNGHSIFLLFFIFFSHSQPACAVASIHTKRRSYVFRTVLGGVIHLSNVGSARKAFFPKIVADVPPMFPQADKITAFFSLWGDWKQLDNAELSDGFLMGGEPMRGIGCSFEPVADRMEPAISQKPSKFRWKQIKRSPKWISGLSSFTISFPMRWEEA